MGFFNFLKYNRTERESLKDCVAFFTTMGLHGSDAKSQATKLLDLVIHESKSGGTYHLPPNFGDIILGDAESQNSMFMKTANIIRGQIPRKKKEGVQNEDIRWWWNLSDIDRGIIIKQEDIIRYYFFKYQLEGISEESREKSADKAIAKIRSTFPMYGDPDDNTHTSGDDRPLPYELKRRINNYDEKRRIEDLENFKSELQKFSSYNALVRTKIRAGEI